MENRTKLLASAALGVLLAVGASAAAEAKPVKHKARPAATATAEDVRSLRAEVEALKQQLAAQAQAQQQTQAQAAQAQADAQTAAAQAQQAQARAEDQIKLIPDQVKTVVIANRPKPGWEGSTQVSGRMYFDLSNISAKRDGVKQPASGTGFDIKRFYVGIDHKFNDTFSGNITTDVAYSSATGLDQVYIKKAYLQAKLSDALVVRLGSADLPWIPFAEDVYGYRFIENTVADRDKFGTSADWGVHASGKLAGGKINYAVSAINGNGYKNPTRSKTMDLEGRLSSNLGPVVIGIGGYSGKLGKDVEGAVVHHTASRFDAIAAYIQPRFRVGVEYFGAKDWNNVTTVAEDKSDGASVFGNFNFNPQVSLFGRYDWVKPSKDLNPNEKDHYFNVGLNYEPVKIVDLALVYKRDAIDAGSLATSNGTIGGLVKGTYDEVGLFGQFRW